MNAKNEMAIHALYWDNVATLATILDNIKDISPDNFEELIESIDDDININCLGDTDFTMHRVSNNEYLVSYRFFHALIIREGNQWIDNILSDYMLSL